MPTHDNHVAMTLVSGWLSYYFVSNSGQLSAMTSESRSCHCLAKSAARVRPLYGQPANTVRTTA